MEEKNKRKTIILLIIGTIALIGAVVGATFAYFAAQVGAGDKAQINAEAGTTDSLTFDKGKDLVINANQSNFYENAGDLKDSTTLSAHLVAGNDDNDAHYKYNIYLDIASNNFEYTSGSEPELVLLVQDPEGTYLEEIPGLTKSNITIDGESYPCFDITTQSGLITIQEDYLIDATPETQGKADHTWNITVVFKNLPTDQHDNTNKTFNAKITIQSEKMNFLAINGIDYEDCTDGLSSCIGGDISYYREDTYRNKIKNVYFVDHINEEQLKNAVQSYDLSSEKDKSIMGWLVEETGDSLVPYNLYIGSNEKIMVRDFSNAFENMKNLETIDLGTDVLDTTYMNNMSHLFAFNADSSTEKSKLNKVTGLANLDTHNVTNMSYLFNKTNGITTIEDIGNWNTSNVIDMSNMFGHANILTDFDLSTWNVSKVIDMSHMFSNVNNEITEYVSIKINLSDWDTHNVTNMSFMFYRCSYSDVTGIGDFNVSKVTNMSGMFFGTKFANNLSNWDTSNVTNMSSMFSNCYGSIDLSNWNTSKVTNMSQMFLYYYGSIITGIENLDVLHVNNMSNMFLGAKNLVTLDLSKWDTKNVTNMNRMFSETTNLRNIDMRKATFSQVTSYDSMLDNTNSNLKVTITGDANKEWFIQNAGTGYSNIGLTAEQLENMLVVLPE